MIVQSTYSYRPYSSSINTRVSQGHSVLPDELLRDRLDTSRTNNRLPSRADGLKFTSNNLLHQLRSIGRSLGSPIPSERGGAYFVLALGLTVLHAPIWFIQANHKGPSDYAPKVVTQLRTYLDHAIEPSQAEGYRPHMQNLRDSEEGQKALQADFENDLKRVLQTLTAQGKFSLSETEMPKYLEHTLLQAYPEEKQALAKLRQQMLTTIEQNAENGETRLNKEQVFSLVQQLVDVMEQIDPATGQDMQTTLTTLEKDDAFYAKWEPVYNFLVNGNNALIVLALGISLLNAGLSQSDNRSNSLRQALLESTIKRGIKGFEQDLKSRGKSS